MATHLTRRLVLLAGAALPGAALAQRRPPTPHHGAHAGKPGEAEATGAPADTPVGPVDTAARWAFVMDYNTSTTLLSKDADEQMPPSSMTKVMTAYIVYGMLKAKRLSLDQMLPVSDKAWRMGGSKMFVPQGGQVKAEDLVRGMIVQSGNDACIVLAEGIAGSEDAFVELMNAKAREMGLTNTTYKNTTGWPDAGHLSTAHDIAKLAQRIIQDFPEYYRYDSEKTFKFNNIEQGNRNTLVQKGLADGLKTGHTEAGGYGLVASAERNQRRVIIVVNGLTTMKQRTEEGERLLEWAFREFEDVKLFAVGDAVEQAPVWLGAEQTVPLVGGRDLIVTMPRNWRSNAKISIEYASPIPAPVTRGSVLGKLSVSGLGVPVASVDLLAGADVPRLGLPGRAIGVLAHMVTGA